MTHRAGIQTAEPSIECKNGPAYSTRLVDFTVGHAECYSLFFVVGGDDVNVREEDSGNFITADHAVSGRGQVRDFAQERPKGFVKDRSFEIDVPRFARMLRIFIHLLISVNT